VIDAKIRVFQRYMSQVGTEAVRLVTEHGWTEGLAVPVPRGGTLFGLVSLVGQSKELTEHQRSLLSLISEHFLARVRALGPPAKFPVPPAGLSEREIECLRLVAQGASDAEIAESLGVAASTAHGHVEGARRKLQAKSRAQATALAVSLGIIQAG
jgi:LuxR family transcriptional regulator, quorum-sensing system regulator BjaR1